MSKCTHVYGHKISVRLNIIGQIVTFTPENSYLNILGISCDTDFEKII